jgi:hypothetical protein
MSNIFIGGKDIYNKNKKNEFRNNLYELLQLKFKVKLNAGMSSYLGDLFLTSESFEKGLLKLSLVFMLLGRLNEKSSNLNDILIRFRKTFGEENYDLYIKNHLPRVLSSYSNSTYLNIYKKGYE